MGSFPQVGANIKKKHIWNLDLRYDWIPKDGDLLWV